MKAFLIAALLISTIPAYAAEACRPRAEFVVVAKEDHGEQLQSIALTPNQNVLEVYANTQTGTWTIFISKPTGISCYISSGVAFQRVK